MFLLHEILGPLQLYEWIFFFGHHFVIFAKYAIKHYYITSVVIVVTFGYSFVTAIVKWTTQRSERQFREDLEATLLRQSVMIHELQEMLDNRIQTLEDNQNEILRTLKELKDAVRPPS
jgi:low affinity Fe/Cu permease